MSACPLPDVYWSVSDHVFVDVCVPCPSSVSSGRTGCRSLWPAALPVSGWSSRRSSSAWQDLAVFRPEKRQRTNTVSYFSTIFSGIFIYLHEFEYQTNNMAIQAHAEGGWSHEEDTTLMFCASTLALASSRRLMTVVLPASTAQCSAVFLWYLSPRLTDTLKVSSSRVGSTLSHRGIISS